MNNRTPERSNDRTLPGQKGAHAYLEGRYRGSKYAWIHRVVPSGSEVLDLGCGNGLVGLVLAEKGCKVDGVEQDPAAAEEARRHYRRVWVEDLCTDGAWRRRAAEYDVVVLADVLEHLPRPEYLLAEIRGLMRGTARLLVCLPNVAHHRMRWELLRGRFDYRSEGLLDRTHLRFYTRNSARQLLTGAGLRIVEEHPTYVRAGWKGPLVAWLAWRWPTLFAEQFCFMAEPETK
jgi:methionine biosynthesis protein MetW